MLLTLLSRAWSQDCATATSTLDVERRLTKVEVAFSEIDSVALIEARSAARSALTCLGEPASPSLAARVHRVEALTALDANNRGLAEQAFASARSIEPDFVLPAELATETVEEVYRALDPAKGADQAVPPPREGRILIDGQPLDRRALERPWRPSR